MINFLLGAPGGGKSYEAVVYHVLPALEQGRKVITNLALNIDEICALDSSYRALIEIRTETKAVRPEIDWGKAQSNFQRFGIPVKQTWFNNRPFANLEDYGDLWRHPETGTGPLYVIDECHLALPARGTPIPVEEWYSLHRHEFADVLLISQSYGKVNKAICDLVQVAYRVRKATMFGSSDSYIRKVQDGLRGEVVNTSIRRYKPSFFRYYNSHTKSGAGSELAAKDVKPIWRHWSVWGAGVCMSFVLAMGAAGWLNPFPKKVDNGELDLSLSTPVDPVPYVPQALPLPMVQTVPVQSPETSSVPDEPTDNRDKARLSGPLASVTLHITGSLTARGATVYYFALAQNGQVVRVMNSKDLEPMGYSVKGLGECAAEVSGYGAFIYSICDAPSVTAAPFSVL